MQKPDRHILTIFGASGDLARRKLIPSIFNLYIQDLLPVNFALLGTGRKGFGDESFRDHMRQALEDFSGNDADPGRVKGFLDCLYYTSIDTTDPADYARLKNKLDELGRSLKTGDNHIFYLATPPSLYARVADSLAGQGLARGQNGWRRIVVEKPFGYDLASSRELNRQFREVFDEEQIYRIDHYLGKETVQNIMVTRFSNAIFEPVWNRNFVHHVEITASESMGVGSRGGYYEGSGALRDMFQNHLLQLVALVAMEPPVWANSGSIRNEIVKVLESLRPFSDEDLKRHVIRGQYTESRIRGEETMGYRQETGVDPESRTETYVGIKFFIDNWRWKGVPFYARTGKRLPLRVTEIVVHFQPTPHHIFSGHQTGETNYNQLIIRIQPDEGLLIKFGMKVPGAGYKVQTVNMDFHYSDLSDTYLPAAYERLLHDCMLGDSTLYARGDAVECAWGFVDPVLKYWEQHPEHALYGYPAGTWGPKEADDLIEEKRLTWRYPSKNLADDGIYCEL
jgi:glucose-6-phosphate 1-dehydrogenase